MVRFAVGDGLPRSDPASLEGGVGLLRDGAGARCGQEAGDEAGYACPAGHSIPPHDARGGTAGDLVRTLAEAGFEVVALSPAGAEPLADYRRAPRTAILLGAEGPGLPRHVLERTRTVRIAMADGFDSLNVATASGIALHRVMRGR